MATAHRIRTPLPPSARRFRKRALLLAALAVIGFDLAYAPAAAAPGDPATVEEAASLVAERGHQLEVLTEKFNEARETLDAQKAAAAAAEGDVVQAEADLAAVRDQLADVAQTAYTGDGLGALQAFMTSGSPEEFLDRVTLLESVAGHHNDVVDRVAKAQAAAQEAKASAEQAAAEAQRQVDEVAVQQADLQSEIADFQAQYTALTAAQQEEADAAHGGRTLTAPPATAVVADTAAAQAAVDTAMAQLGDPYVWAAAGPDAFDCSGLTQYAFAAAGISLPHSSRMQASMGQAVSRADLQPGDLVYFYSPVSHIGIYIGGGQMVHASTFGEPVKVGSVDMSGYAGARRVV